MKWIIAFLDDYANSGMRWYQRLLKPGYRHVVAMSWHPGTGTWFYMDWQATHMTLEPLSDSQASAVLAFLMAEATCVSTHARHGGGSALRFGSCVGAVKHLLGRRWPCVLTPWQLYCALRREGAPLTLVPHDSAPPAVD